MKLHGIYSKKENKIFWEKAKNVELTTAYKLNNDYIWVNTKDKKQIIKGFGGAFTESSAYNYSKLNEKFKKEFLRAYFTSDGLNYNLGRVHINSCDFALNNYTYIADDDVNLETFSLTRDEQYIIPMLADTYNLVKVKLMASPWSPPAFMKDNKNMNHGGKLLNEYRSSWANYYVKYLKIMQSKGYEFFALSLQNEPAAKQTWDSCLYTPEEERDFAKDYLIPALRKNDLEIEVYLWDHNRGNELLTRAITFFSDEHLKKEVSGIAFHWYCNEDFASLNKYHQMFPDKELIFSEGCVEYGVYGSESIMSFQNGEHYAKHMIGDFNNYNNAFIDWNLLLDINGGPNHVNNLCEALVMYDEANGKLIYNASYYYVGHFSKYVRGNAHRITSVVNDYTNQDIHSVSFVNEDETLVIIILNLGLEKKVSLIVDGLGCEIVLPEHSIITYVSEKGGK